MYLKINQLKLAIIERISYSNKYDENEKKIISEDKPISEQISNNGEIQKYVFSQGGCFGDWAIIFKQKRCASAKAIENSFCLKISTELFDSCFSKKILKYENERKKFLKKKLEIVEEYHEFNRFVKIYVIIYDVVCIIILF